MDAGTRLVGRQDLVLGAVGTGEYAVQVWVRSTGSTAKYDAWLSSGFVMIK